MRRFWTQEEDEFLRKNYEKMTKKEIGKYLGRTEYGVKRRADELDVCARAGVMKKINLKLAPIDTAYVAGLFDGEAYVGLVIEHKNDTRSGYCIRPCITLSLTKDDQDAIYWIKNVLKIGRVYSDGAATRRKTGYEAVSFTVRAKEEVLSLINLILPYSKVSTTKKRLQLLKAALEISPKYKSLTPADFRKLVALAVELRKLSKKKGPKEKRVSAKEILSSPFLTNAV